jgi:hypothetical protein
MGPNRGWFLTVAAILFVLLAISNFLKPVSADANTGFVFFDRRLSGIPNDILGPAFGILLLVYVIAIWRMRNIPLPLAWLYAGYVVANTILFSMHTATKPHSTAFMAATLIIGLGIPISSAIVLTAKRAQLTLERVRRCSCETCGFISRRPRAVARCWRRPCTHFDLAAEAGNPKGLLNYTTWSHLVPRDPRILPFAPHRSQFFEFFGTIVKYIGRPSAGDGLRKTSSRRQASG